MKKFNQWYNEAIEDGKIVPSLKSDSDMDHDPMEDEISSTAPRSSLGSGILGKTAARASSLGEKKLFNARQIEELVDTFVKQFNKPSEQRAVVRILKKKLMHAKDMFKPDAEIV